MVRIASPVELRTSMDSASKAGLRSKKSLEGREVSGRIEERGGGRTCRA